MAESKSMTCFLYNTQAEEAARFYTSIFPDAKMGQIAKYPPEGPMPEGTVITASFSMLGQEFVAVNCGADIPHTEGTSVIVLCDNQKEIDLYWDKLQEGGGKPHVCGWLKDRFGISWQVTPKMLMNIWSDTDQARAARVMKAMRSMVKLDIAALENAYRGPGKQAA